MGNLPPSDFAEIPALGHFQNNGPAGLQFFLDACPVGVVTHTADGKIAFINTYAKQLLNARELSPLSVEDFAKAFHLYVLESDRLYPNEQLPFVRALQGEQVCLEDIEMRRGDRRTLLQAKAAPLLDETGQVALAVVIWQDISPKITEQTIDNRYNQALAHQVQLRTADLEREILIRQHIENQLRQNQVRFERLSEAVPGVIYSLVIDAAQTARFEYVNRRITAIYEAPLKQISQAPLQFLLTQMHPSDRPGFEAEFARCTETLTVFSYEWRHQSPSGVQCWLQTHAQPERRANGELCWHGWLLDVTLRKQTELKLQQNLTQTSAILMAIPDLIFRVNLEGDYVACVRNNPEVNVLPPDVDVVGCHVTDFLPPDSAARHLQVIETTLATGELQVFEQTLTVRGRIQHEEIRMVPCDADTVLVIVRDISDRKAAELGLQASESKHRHIVAALPDLMFRVSGDGYWLGYIQTNAKIDYLPKNYDPAGSHISDHMPAAVAQRQLEKVRQALTTGTVQVFEQQLSIGDGQQYEEVRVIPQGDHEVLFIVRDITDRKTAELALKQSEAQNRAILAAIPDLMFRLHRDGTFLSYFKNENAQDLVEKQDHPVGRNIAEYAAKNEFYRTHVERQMQAVHQVLQTGEILIYEQQLTINGKDQYEEVRVIPCDEDEVLIIIQDTGDRKAAELALQQSEAQKQAILTAIPDLMFYMRRDGLILDYLNGTNFVDLLDDGKSHVGHNLLDFATTDEVAVHIQQKMQMTHQALATGKMQLYEQETSIGGVQQHEEVRVVPVNDQEVLIMIRDISDRKRIEAELRLANERLEKLSLTDPLTMLANRRSLDEYLQREWQRAIREQSPVSFILFDLDHFKRFNDTYGHQAGDNCLHRVAQAVAEIVCRSSDLVARYGGEEFAIVLANTDLRGAFVIAQRIRERVLSLQIPHTSSPIDPVVTASVGVSSIIPQPDSLPNVLIRQADQALYSAKQAGRNNCQCFISRPVAEDDR